MSDQRSSPPQFDRINYFYGQMLNAQDFRTEQAFVREKMKLLNRCLHGYGIVCGLGVQPACPEDSETCAPTESQEKARRSVYIDPGLALDPEGNELVLRERTFLDLFCAMPEEDREKLQDLLKRRAEKKPKEEVVLADRAELIKTKKPGERTAKAALQPADKAALQPADSESLPIPEEAVEQDQSGSWLPTLLLYACYTERMLEPVRAIVTDSCGSPIGQQYSRIRDGLCFRVDVLWSGNQREQDPSCGSCCEGPEERCILLARIVDYNPSGRLRAAQVDLSVRRPVGPYQPTTIVGVNWTHGHRYARGDLPNLLSGGLTVRFSRPVQVATLQPGVFDVLVMDGGTGQNSMVWSLQGGLVGLPARGTVQEITWQQTSSDQLSDGDRVLIILRSNFILDACCKPVDGANIGGGVPNFDRRDEEERSTVRPSCPTGQPRLGPWVSGTGQSSDNFESWFYITDPMPARKAPAAAARKSVG